MAPKAERQIHSIDTSAINPRSYEHFASQPFYQAVDKALVQKAPVVQHVVDFATGTGAIIEHLFALEKLKSPFAVIGVDIDPKSLETAAEKFRDFAPDEDPSSVDTVEFVRSGVERIPQIKDNSQDLVTFCNSIHLTNIQESLGEAVRILKPGGMLLVNSAYEKLHALPEGSHRLWGLFIALAQEKLKQQGFGVNGFSRPVDLFLYSEDEYKAFAEGAGLKNVEIQTHTASVDLNALQAIGSYEDFAKGALPGIPIEQAANALVDAAKDLFDRLAKRGIESIPRNWMFLSATKPAF